jgi:hypothetical protein
MLNDRFAGKTLEIGWISSQDYIDAGFYCGASVAEIINTSSARPRN